MDDGIVVAPAPAAAAHPVITLPPHTAYNTSTHFMDALCGYT
jgi:hypothetical protein